MKVAKTEVAMKGAFIFSNEIKCTCEEYLLFQGRAFSRYPLLLLMRIWWYEFPDIFTRKLLVLILNTILSTVGFVFLIKILYFWIHFKSFHIFNPFRCVSYGMLNIPKRMPQIGKGMTIVWIVHMLFWHIVRVHLGTWYISALGCLSFVCQVKICEMSVSITWKCFEPDL